MSAQDQPNRVVIYGDAEGFYECSSVEEARKELLAKGGGLITFGGPRADDHLKCRCGLPLLITRKWCTGGHAQPEASA